MTMLADDSAVMTKARELCATIADDERFLELQKQVETFLGDDAAKTMYQSVHERGSELQQKQQSGVELGETEIREFEGAREELLARVWGYANHMDIETRTVDIHIAKLRRKIELDPKLPKHLTTVRGAGYRLVVEA